MTSINHGRIFDTKLKGTLPFLDDYFVDLSTLSLDKVRFDNVNRTLFVEVPEVFITPPNINLEKGTLNDIEGWWVSRSAARDLVNRAVKLANRKATEEAAKPENMEKARVEGRKRIANLLSIPLQATGRGELQGVRISVRFPTDGIRGGDPWDVGPTISEVLARNRDVQK